MLPETRYAVFNHLFLNGYFSYTQESIPIDQKIIDEVINPKDRSDTYERHKTKFTLSNQDIKDILNGTKVFHEKMIYNRIDM